MPLKGCLFDLDGLLLDTEVAHTNASNRVLAQWGHRVTSDLKKKTIGGHSLKNAQIAVDYFGLPVTAVEYNDLLQPVLFEYFQVVKFRPGAKELIEKLHALRIPMAIATSSGKVRLEQKMTSHKDTFALFDGHIVCLDDPRISGKHKPDPAPYIVAAAEIGLTPDECVVFEDSPVGLQAGVNAGASVVWIPDTSVVDLSGDIDKGLLSKVTVLDSLAQFDPLHWGFLMSAD